MRGPRSLALEPHAADHEAVLDYSSQRPAALVVLVGLFRNWAGRQLQSQLFEANPSVHFDVALHTGEQQCSDKDVASGRCSCIESVKTRGGGSLSDAIADTAVRVYGTYLMNVTVQHGTEHTFDERWAAAWPAVRRLMHRGRGDGERAYQHLIVLRPDVALTKPLALAETCAHSPGLNIISGSFTRPYVFHNRDWDFGYLACGAAAARAAWGESDDGAAELLRDSPEANACCHTPPPLSPDFKGSWTACALDARCSDQCSFGWACLLTKRAKRAGLRFGTLDQHGVFARMLRCDDANASSYVVM